MDAESQVDALLDLYRSLTPEQQSLFSSQQSTTSSSANSPGRSLDMSPYSNSSPSPQPTSNLLSTSRSSMSRARARQVKSAAIGGAGKKRPLNAFMAFRCKCGGTVRNPKLRHPLAYYSPQLAGMTQKIKSGLMQRMWNAEPNKHIWHLVAKAYTDVRDNHTDHTALDKFLAVVTPALPVVPSHSYLADMGWEVTTLAGEHTIARSSGFDAEAHAAKYPAQTILSANDLVKLCYQAGLIRSSSRITRRAQGNLVSMPFAATPKGAVNRRTKPDDRIFDVSVLNHWMVFSKTNKAKLDHTLNAMHSSDASTSAMAPAFDFNNLDVDMPTNYLPSINTVTADQQKAYENTPFALHFHPEVQPPVLGFDHRLIQDDFDPFNFDLELADIFDFSA